MMINEVISKIQEAEKQAEEIINQAREKEKSVSQSTDLEIENMKKENDREIKTEIVKILAEAQNLAEIKAAEIMKEAEISANQIVKIGERNEQKVVEYLADVLQKQNKRNT